MFQIVKPIFHQKVKGRALGDGFCVVAQPTRKNRPRVRSIAGEKAHKGTVPECRLRGNTETVPVVLPCEECTHSVGTVPGLDKNRGGSAGVSKTEISI